MYREYRWFGVSGNVVVIDVDSLRPDHMSCYGYSRETTPEIDAIADEGAVFTNSYAANTPCIPSRANFLTGRYGTHNGVVTHGHRGMTLNKPEYWSLDKRKEADEREWQNLTELLYHNDVHTCAVSTFPRHPAPWFTQTWNEFYQPKEQQGEFETFATPRGDKVADIAIENMNLSGNSMTYIQFWDPHFPYKQEKTYSFSSEPEIPYPTKGQLHSHLTAETPMNPTSQDIETYEDLEKEVDKYDNEVRFVDEQIGRIISEVKNQNEYENTLFIIIGDHGEEFGEHGVYKHHANIHDTTQKIPMIISGPSVNTGSSDAIVTNADLAPTIASYFDLEVPKQWQGSELTDVLADNEQKVREYIVLEHGLYTAQRAVLHDGWKLIHTLHSGGWNDIPETQLYKVSEDPYEQINRVDSNGDKARELENLMNEWLRGRNTESGIDYLEEVADSGPSGWRFWSEWNKEN